MVLLASNLVGQIANIPNEDMPLRLPIHGSVCGRGWGTSGVQGALYSFFAFCLSTASNRLASDMVHGIIIAFIEFMCGGPWN